MKTIISLRIDEDHLAYIYQTLLTQGYEPSNLTDLIRMSTIDWIKHINPTIIHTPPNNTSINQIKRWRAKNKSFKTLINNNITIPTTTPIPQKNIINNSILSTIPMEYQNKASMIIAAINAGIPMEQQLNHSDPEIAKIAKLINDAINNNDTINNNDAINNNE